MNNSYREKSKKRLFYCVTLYCTIKIIGNIFLQRSYFISIWKCSISYPPGHRYKSTMHVFLSVFSLKMFCTQLTAFLNLSHRCWLFTARFLSMFLTSIISFEVKASIFWCYIHMIWARTKWGLKHHFQSPKNLKCQFTVLFVEKVDNPKSKYQTGFKQSTRNCKFKSDKH